MFQRVAIAQARALGNLLADREPDWAQPDLAHALIGDGTIVTPFSDVRVTTCPVTGRRIVEGSHARNPRVATVTTDLSEDGKTDRRGLNMVHLLTPTQWGWVVLGTGTAHGAELWAAQDLLDSVASRVGTGFHNLLWDRVFTGWAVDYVMAKHGATVINKAVAASNNRVELKANDDEREAQRVLAARVYNRLISETRQRQRWVDHTEGHKAVRADEPMRARMARAWRQDELQAIYYSGAPQPLGVSLYTSTSASNVTGAKNASRRGKMEVVLSKFHYLRAETYTGPHGPCEHELFVDDGALHSVEPDIDQGYLVKTATARTVRSTRQQGTGGKWSRTTTFEMPCSNGAFTIDITWRPSDTRYAQGDDRKRELTDPALTDLRPVSRAQREAFANTANFRNIAESYNAWYKSRLPNRGRAATIEADSQELDYLAGACVANAITWARWKEDQG